MKEETIKILKIEPNKEPYEKEIKNDLASLQKEVGGLIELIYADKNCLMVINEEGKLNGSLPNRWLGKSDIICGEFFVCGDDGENFTSLNQEQLDLYKQHFNEIPEFSGTEEQLEPKAFMMGFDFK